MSKQTGFCLRRDEHGLVGASVTANGDRWTVDDLHRAVPHGRLSNELQSAMCKASTPVTWLLAEDEAGMSHLNMPKLRPKALQKAFAGGLARDEGGQPDDWNIAWKALSSAKGPGGQDKLSYILYHATKELVAEKVALTRDWGLELRRLLPAHLALDLFYRAHGPARGDHAVWNLVFIGQDQRFLCVATRDGQLVIRNLPANLSTDNNEEDSQEYLQRLATEIDRSAFFARQTENSPEVEKIIVCGDPELAGPLVDVLSETSSIPVLHWAIEEMFQWGLNEQNPDDLVVLAGAVLATEKVPFNLLPDQGQLYISRNLRRRVGVAAATCAAAVVPVLLVGGVLTARIQSTYLDRAEARLEEAQVRAQQAERAYDAQRVLLAREDRIRRFARTRPDFESVLLRLATITPAEIVFQDLQVREQDDGRFLLQLTGESQALTGARAQGAFLKFLANLDGCGFLTRLGEPGLMQIKPSLDTEGPGKITVFRLDMEWRGPDNQGDR